MSSLSHLLAVFSECNFVLMAAFLQSFVGWAMNNVNDSRSRIRAHVGKLKNDPGSFPG